ncbi:MAG: hypothetical protein ACOYB8_05450 [Eubacteriaceae bacterium]|jgi:ribosomal protein L14E/L6E/L27E
MNPLVPGQIVRSTAGRDKGLFLVVMDIADDRHVLVCDGRLRKTTNPKKKKIMHLAKTNKTAAGIESRLRSGDKVTNAEIRRVLEPYNGTVENKTQLDCAADIPKETKLG